MRISDSDRRIAHALLDLPPAHRHAAFLDLTDRVFPRTPAERLIAWQRKRRREAFIAWMRTLGTAEMANVYARLQQGADPDAVRAEYPPAPKPAPDGAGSPTDGNHGTTPPRNGR